MTAPLERFVHRFVPATRSDARASLLLLHGSGGDENDLLPLGPLLAPGAALLSPRGRVLEGTMHRYFRRVREGVFDLEDLGLRTDELAEWIAAAMTHYALDPKHLIAVGFSNGANIAANLMWRHPRVLAGAALLAPMAILAPGSTPVLAGVPVFIGAGRTDPVAPPEQARRLAEILADAGAHVTPHWDPGGHSISPMEVEAARRWLGSAVLGSDGMTDA